MTGRFAGVAFKLTVHRVGPSCLLQFCNLVRRQSRQVSLEKAVFEARRAEYLCRRRKPPDIEQRIALA
ncbi:MAG: hypothetical protein O2931_10785, partial [Planctomycetota bacterium]|nr:hypothetical protein [Planctomycetota bacterium]